MSAICASKNLPEELLELLKIGQQLRMQCYRGRFAPSPTGPLHLGNLRTALVSWLKARLNEGEWLLRIDDLDTPRNRSGAIESIQKDLLWLGLDWNGPIVFQSQRIELYMSILSALKSQGKLYPCRCTRRLLAKRNQSQSKEFIYPGTCRELGLSWDIKSGRLPSLRLIVREEFSISSGDVVVRRADGLIAYHLATAADELLLGINEVVRGQDLAKALHSQLAIIDALDQKPVFYRHVPLFFNNDGTKMSKREGGIGIRSLGDNDIRAANVIGYLASSLDLVPNGSVLSALELLSHVRKDKELLEPLLGC